MRLRSVFVVVSSASKILLWLIVWGSFRLLQMCWWLLNGTYSTRSRNTKNYDTSAHVLDILGRYKLGQVIPPNTLLDFIVA